ncbi:xanthine dehydrogenase family protein molybdopterin-binding subunit [soil metagenome]
MAVAEKMMPVGEPRDRVDGRLKVTGKATYAAEAPVQGCVHAVIVQSTISKGKITSMDLAAAKAAPGVLTILTKENMPALTAAAAKVLAEKRAPLGDDDIHYAGQHIAVVVADTIEHARAAAAMVVVKYDEQKPVVRVDDPAGKRETPKEQFGAPMQVKKGDVKGAIATPGAVQISGVYRTPIETHNPMEMSATVAHWEADDKVTVWDATQAVVGRAQSIAAVFDLKPANVRVLCPYVGGAFGCKGDQWMHTVLAVAAAKVVKKPVKLMLTRAQMFTSCGQRPTTEQHLTLAADASGKLLAIQHDSTMDDSVVGKHVEPCGHGSSGVAYETKTLGYTHTVVRNKIAPATLMRAPGENPGMFALESAMDELAYALKIDPLKLRDINYSEKAPATDLPFSTKALRECYRIGAEKFGWSNGKHDVGSVKSPTGKRLGWGVATATYPGHRFPNQARIRLINDNGTVRAGGQCATQDLGTGAYTVCTQMTAMLIGMPMERTKFELGDTYLPPGGVSGGSATTAGVGQALSEAATKLRDAVHKVINNGQPSPLAGLAPAKIKLMGDTVLSVDDPTKSEKTADLIARSGRSYLEGISDPSTNGADDIGSKKKKTTFQSFGVHFVEVEIGDPVPTIRVTRVVSVMDVGRVINPKTARSQVIGGVVMGIGQALLEQTVYDDRTGRPVTDNLADYAVCVNADIPEIEVAFAGEPDMLFNAIGCRGVGEIGITGIAAAVANAVHHATGKRVRELPITMDKLL